jgi:hypothetical protein
MATCAKCGAALPAAARFCGACGARVLSTSLPLAKPPAPSADPFAKTVFGESPGPPGPSPSPPEGRLPPAPAHGSPTQGASAHGSPTQGASAHGSPTQGASAHGAPAHPPPAPAPGGYAPGALVLVHWADGKRYPATVLHATASHVLVVFPTGQQQWVDVRYVSSG